MQMRRCVRYIITCRYLYILYRSGVYDGIAFFYLLHRCFGFLVHRRRVFTRRPSNFAVHLLTTRFRATDGDGDFLPRDPLPAHVAHQFQLVRRPGRAPNAALRNLLDVFIFDRTFDSL